MNKSIRNTLALVLLALLLATCGPATPPEGETDPASGVRIGGSVWVYRIIDTEAQVACWVYSGRRGASYSLRPPATFLSATWAFSPCLRAGPAGHLCRVAKAYDSSSTLPTMDWTFTGVLVSVSTRVPNLPSVFSTTR